VQEGSLADEWGLRPGDCLVAIDGHVLRDVIDYHFYAAEERLELEIERAGERLALVVEREYGQDLGVTFTEDVFDGLRRCRNQCTFCFVDQMPPGLRASLYVKDDDYRYSFLHGNFITLTNWAEEDWERVAEQHLSPLYVSVHSTDPETRRRLFCNPRAPDVMQQLERLAGSGIEVHTQIVVIPGWNDGEQLERTVRDLTGLFPAVASIGVVPVGLTRYHRGGVRLLDSEEECAILEVVVSRQQENRRKLGVGLVYGADELYVRTGYVVPPAEEYDGYPQLENGIGLVRQLLEEGEALKRAGASARVSGRGTVVCGTLIAPTLGRMCRELTQGTGLDLAIMPVENDFLGATVTVSGLLTGRDVVAALQGEDLGEAAFVPRAMFDSLGQVTLDGLSKADLQGSLGVPVVTADGMTAVLDHFSGNGGGCR
jgi:putative radical SAM enzyme (TIGR03279 family)